MDVLTALLIILVAIAILFEVARRIGVPYPTLFVPDPTETAERRQERVEHEQIQRGVIAAQRSAVIGLRDRGEINDLTLRAIERELDLEEIRMEA